MTLGAIGLALLPAIGWGYDVILDKSGSMAGFAKAGDRWQGFLKGLEAQSDGRYAFGNDVRRLPSGSSLFSIALNDESTKLDAAMTKWLGDTSPGASAIIITDNVVDYQSADSTAGQQRFYSNFTASDAPVSHLGIIVLRLPFNGKVYPLGDGKGQDYTGNRALVLYVLSRGDAAGFETLLSRVQAVLGELGLSHRAIRVKPFDRTALRSRGPNQGFPIHTPEELKGKLQLKDGIIWMRDLAVGDDVRFPLKVEISSDSPFVLRDVHADAQITFRDPEGMIQPGAFTITVDPPTADVAPGDARTFTILVSGSGFLLLGETSLLDRALLTLRRAAPVEGDLNVRFTANLRNLDLSEGLLAEWNHEAAGDLGDAKAADSHARVFMLKPLVLGLLPMETVRSEELLHERLGVRIDLRHPLAPLMGALIALVAVVVAVIFLLLWLLKRREFILLDEHGDEQRFVPSLFGRKRVYGGGQDGAGPVFSLLYLLAGFLVLAGRDYRLRSGRWLSSQRGMVKMQRLGADDYDLRVWNLRSARAPAGRGSKDPWADG